MKIKPRGEKRKGFLTKIMSVFWVLEYRDDKNKDLFIEYIKLKIIMALI